jgi:hypothetical protein
MYTGMMAFFGPVLESVLGCLAPSPSSYAKTITPLLFAKALEKHNGSMFNPKAQPVLKSKFLDDKLISTVIERSKALIKEKTGLDV